MGEGAIASAHKLPVLQNRTWNGGIIVKVIRNTVFPAHLLSNGSRSGANSEEGSSGDSNRQNKKTWRKTSAARGLEQAQEACFELSFFSLLKGAVRDTLCHATEYLV